MNTLLVVLMLVLLLVQLWLYFKLPPDRPLTREQWRLKALMHLEGKARRPAGWLPTLEQSYGGNDESQAGNADGDDGNPTGCEPLAPAQLSLGGSEQGTGLVSGDDLVEVVGGPVAAVLSPGLSGHETDAGAASADCNSQPEGAGGVAREA